MKLILSAAYFDIINKSFIAYYIFTNKKNSRESEFLFVVKCLAVKKSLHFLAEDLDVHIAMM
jgi:hypothetical protein